MTEGSGELVPDSAMSCCSITEEAGASPSHPSTAGFMGATLKAPIAGSSQILGSIGTIVNPDVHADTEHDLALEAGTEARPTQPPHPLLIVDVPSGYPKDLETFGTPDTVNVEDNLSVDVTPLTSISIDGMDVTSCSDMSVAASKIVDLGTSMSVDFDDHSREIQNISSVSTFVDDTPGAYSLRNPSLVPNVGHANLVDPAFGTHPVTAQGPTSLCDTASGGFPLMALGRYTDPDDSFAQAQTWFWTHASRRDRDVDFGSDFSIPEFDSRSELHHYFAERGTRRDSSTTVSAGTQARPHTWTLMVPDPSQLGPYLLSDIGTSPSQFKRPKTPPPRTVVATTRTEMFMRHTSQDVMVSSPTGHRHSSSSSTFTGSWIPGPLQTSPRSSVQQWLDALDTQAPPPPTPAIPVSQPVSMYSGVTSSMPLRYSASQMAAQWVRSSRHSQMSRRSRFSTTSATVIQGMMDFSTQMSNNIAHLAEGVRVDAVNREEAMRQEAQMARHESLVREQCHCQQGNERDRVQREEA